MPECKLCGSYFPNKLRIDGKVKNLQNRKYCLKCSPFGKNNRRNLEKNNDLIERTCGTCGKIFIYKSGNGNNLNKCASCKSSERRRAVKERAIKYKCGKCVICGYCKCNRALEFHHINPSEKDFHIAGNPNMRWDKLKEELDKCVLLCSNCHREVEEGITNIDGAIL